MLHDSKDENTNNIQHVILHQPCKTWWGSSAPLGHTHTWRCNADGSEALVWFVIGEPLYILLGASLANRCGVASVRAVLHSLDDLGPLRFNTLDSFVFLHVRILLGYSHLNYVACIKGVVYWTGFIYTYMYSWFIKSNESVCSKANRRRNASKM